MKNDKKQSMRQEKTAKWRKFARKRWVYPAVYLGLAAIVIAAVLWMQVGTDINNHSIGKQNVQNGATTHNPVAYNHNHKQAVPVNTMKETFEWPVKNKGAVHVTKEFWDSHSSLADQEAALVLNDHTYRPNTGINLATKSGNSFAVTAAMSGTVVQAEKDPALGYVVTIDDGKGITTSYQSLKSLAVGKGDLVKQGQKLGMAGQSDYFKKAGVILHFEIRANGQPVNPVAFMGQTKSKLLSQEKGKTDKNKQNQPDQNQKNQMKKDQGTSGNGGSQGNTQKQKQQQDQKKQQNNNKSDQQTSKNA